MYACKLGEFNIVQALIEKGARINDEAPRDKTALMFASEQGRLKIVKLLIKVGVDLNARACNGEFSAIDYTGWFGSPIYDDDGGHTKVMPYQIKQGGTWGDGD
ncbi:hypothetical protein CRD36_10090 [Paremcibacter congregatus]|uniref:Uncharacterized protein n=2 Tax=Paremcibacter congregatus TaxID=2043170 RepID=A0A2G4YR48_9PROT|nr:hypothetical protein CRD36_10090 [Paremcibacter congregatus]QDE27998.1 ankyrin repeat domain-containing protein [Paremcibacter congregatus]